MPAHMGQYMAGLIDEVPKIVTGYSGSIESQPGPGSRGSCCGWTAVHIAGIVAGPLLCAIAAVVLPFMALGGLSSDKKEMKNLFKDFCIYESCAIGGIVASPILHTIGVVRSLFGAVFNPLIYFQS